MGQLPAGYEIRQLSDEEFKKHWEQQATKIFDQNSQIFRLHSYLNEEEKTKAGILGSILGTAFHLNLGLYHKGEFVGWSAGHQESAETFYMRNSAVLPDHRRKGLYAILLDHVVRDVMAKGFQKIYSRHSATNNSVIIPKLKYGFMITSLEVTDTFGVLVHLSYFPKELRRKMMVYRVGDMKPDDEIKGCLDL